MIPFYIILWTVLIGNLCIIFFHYSIRNTRFLLKNGIPFFLICAILCCLRFLIPVESKIYHYTEYPYLISQMIRERYFFDGRLALSRIILLVAVTVSIVLIIRYLITIRQMTNYFIKNSIPMDKGSHLLQNIDPDLNIPIRICQKIRTPFICGLIKPIIYFPDFEYSEVDFEHITLHEYTHWVCHHTQIKYFLHIIVLIFWWNPILRIFERDFSHLLELSCDEIILRRYNQAGQLSYLETIHHCLDHAERSRRSTYTPAYFMGFLKERADAATNQRFHYHMAKNYNDSLLFTNILLYMSVFLCFFFSYHFTLQPYYEPSDLIMSDPSNTCIVEDKNGLYHFYYDREDIILTEEEVEAGNFKIYPIIYFEDYKDTGDYRLSQTYMDNFNK